MARAQTWSFVRVVGDLIGQDHGLRLLTVAAMVGFVLIVYAVVVVGGGGLLGHSGSPSLWLSVMETATVAIAFEPVRTHVNRWLSRALRQDRLSPYQVLARFPNTVTGAYPAEELPARMARVLAEGTGTFRAEVWLVARGLPLTPLSRGLYPRLLTDAGPVAAFASGPIPVDLTSSDLPRYPPDVEAAVYFSCLEAVQNASKHSGATFITIEVVGRFEADGSGVIELTVADDGRGFDTTRRTGNGLLNISDRIECVQGGVSITSAVGTGTTIRARIRTAATTLEMPSASDRAVEVQLGEARQVAAPPIAGG